MIFQSSLFVWISQRHRQRFKPVFQTCKRIKKMKPMDIAADLKRAAELIAGADALVINAGAGMGVDSGLPDFRGDSGFWKAYPALAKAQINFMDIADPRTFENTPLLAWGFYGHRLALYRDTVPHAGFEILRKWGERMPFGSRVFASNVDGQFQKAGFPENQINECHGSIHHLQCMKGCSAGVWSAQAFLPIVDNATCQLVNEAPQCPACKSLARPNIVMFGDWAWLEERNLIQQNHEARWFETIKKNAAKVVVVELGAGTAIPSVRHFSQRISRQYHAPIIRINPGESDVRGDRDVGIALGALDGLRGVGKLLEMTS